MIVVSITVKQILKNTKIIQVDQRQPIARSWLSEVILSYWSKNSTKQCEYLHKKYQRIPRHTRKSLIRRDWPNACPPNIFSKCIVSFSKPPPPRARHWPYRKIILMNGQPANRGGDSPCWLLPIFSSYFSFCIITHTWIKKGENQRMCGIRRLFRLSEICI